MGTGVLCVSVGTQSPDRTTLSDAAPTAAPPLWVPASVQLVVPGGQGHHPGLLREKSQDPAGNAPAQGGSPGDTQGLP